MSLEKSNADALYHSQRALSYLGNPSTFQQPVLNSLLAAPETAQLWATYEQLLLSCLRTGDDKSAHTFLQKLTARFGTSNERILGLKGLYQEAVAEGEPALEKILREYNKALSESPTSTPLVKRRVALLKSLNRPVDAITALVELLDFSPTDVEAWAELSDLYFSCCMFPQAIYCLEEVILIIPNAWNIHARLGELLFLSARFHAGGSETFDEERLFKSVSRYCRSIELCDGYFRGYFGLKLTTDKLLAQINGVEPAKSRTSRPLSLETIWELNKKSTAAISDVIEKHSTSITGSEFEAAKALIDGRGLEVST